MLWLRSPQGDGVKGLGDTERRQPQLQEENLSFMAGDFCGERGLAGLGRQEEERGCVVAKGVFPVYRPSRSWSLPNLFVAVPSLGLDAESVLTDPLTFAPGKCILDPSKGLRGTLPGVSRLPAQSRCRNQRSQILPALGKAPAWEAAARR